MTDVIDRPLAACPDPGDEPFYVADAATIAALRNGAAAGPIVTATSLGNDPEYADYLRWRADRDAAEITPTFSGDPVIEDATWEHVRDEDTPDDVENLAYMSLVAENPLRYLATRAAMTVDQLDGLTPAQLVAMLSALEPARREIERLDRLGSILEPSPAPPTEAIERLFELYDRAVPMAAAWSRPARRACGFDA